MKSNVRINQFEEHRQSLLYWSKALVEGIIGKDNFLIFIDRHVDFTAPSDELIDEFISLKGDLKKISSFVKDRMRSDNCEFLRYAMEGGIVKDCLMIVHPDSNLQPFADCKKMKRGYIYRDRRGKEHKIFLCVGTDELIGKNGILRNFELPEYSEMQSSIGKRDVLVDIDLDYFARFFDFKEFALSPQYIQMFFEKNSELCSLIELAKVVNIALEHVCCGDYGNKKDNVNSIKESLYPILGNILKVKFN